MTSDNPWLSRADAAEFLGVCPSTVDRWRKIGRLTEFKTLRGSLVGRPAGRRGYVAQVWVSRASAEAALAEVTPPAMPDPLAPDGTTYVSNKLKR